MQKAADQNLSEEDTSEFVLNMMLAPDGPVMEMLRPFLSEQLGLEALLDVQPGGILLGGRGGRTAEGVRIYSESDDYLWGFSGKRVIEQNIREKLAH
mgnify:CR=1 FL=1